MRNHCAIFNTEEKHSISEGMKGVVLYTRINTSIFFHHVMYTHPIENKAFTRFYYGNMQYEREDTLMGHRRIQLRQKMEDSEKLF